MLINLKQNQQIRILRSRFKEIVKFLKKPSLPQHKKINLYRSPWYLVLGPKNAGKTTLLANSDLRFILQKSISDIHDTTNTSTYEWWATNNAVLVDSPGSYFDQSEVDTQKINSAFFKLFKRYSYRHTPNAIIIAINLEDLARQTRQNKLSLSERICQMVQQLTKTFGKQLPFYFVINKCDLVPGFREFFGELSRDERWQPWGIKLPDNYQNINKPLNLEFNQLMRRINDLLIWRLQHEHHLEKRFLINEFPLQMEQVKQHLLTLIEGVSASLKHKFTLKGLFFTSSTQKTAETSQNYTGHTSPNNDPLAEHSFFSHDLFENVIFRETFFEEKQTTSASLPWLRAALYLTGSVLLALYFSLYLFNFKQQTLNINSVQQTIASYQLLAKNSEIKKSSIEYKLKLLDTLQIALDNLGDDHSIIHRILHPASPTGKLQNQVAEIYNRSLQKLLLPEITGTLTTVLTNSAKNDPLLEYNALQAYLMLSGEDQYNAETIEHLIAPLWQEHYPSNIQKQLSKHLRTLLQNRPIISQVDQKLIATAQKDLMDLKPSELAYIILQTKVQNNRRLSLNLDKDKAAASILTFTSEDSGILSMYTEAQFPSIYPSLIQESAKEALFGNKIIGTRETDNGSENDLQSLTKDLARQYLENYVAAWSTFVNSIKTINFSNITQLNNAIKLLGTRDSLITQLINLIRDNFPPALLETNEHFQALAALANNSDKTTASLSNITAMLDNLSTYLSKITFADDSNKEAFILSTARMRNEGKNDPIADILAAAPTYPEPIKSWLYDIGMNAWQLMINQTQDYINQNWAEEIAPQYQTQLANHFPFAPHATDQASLDSFNYFFAPNGEFDKFFTAYLQPFIDNTTPTWHLKNVDGETLQLSDDTLNMLQRIYAIQFVYFQRRSQKLLIPFKLQLEDMENSLNSVTIALGNQQISYQNNQNYPEGKFIWPDQVDSNSAKVIFTNQDGQQAILQETGPWALLQLLQNSTIKKISNSPKQYQVTFDKDGNAANAVITLEQQSNPFSMKLFNNFRLPEKLG